ncbi:uncharacterized protein [Penaeus vannamei]|uniref:uncharacterized protein isoform X1 n=1 Tax=Penaeus vannamei TaxID=6689 RepID=UPI00387F3D02
MNASVTYISRSGRRREDHHPLQAEVGRSCVHDSHHRLQRGDRRVQEHQLHRLGRGRQFQDTPRYVEALLPELRRCHLRGGQQQREEAEGGQGGAGRHSGVRGGGEASPAGGGQQAGHFQGAVRAAAERGPRPAAPRQALARAAHVRHHVGGRVRGPGLAGQGAGLVRLAREAKRGTNDSRRSTWTPGASPYAAGPQRGHGRGIRTREDPNTGRVKH